jgi:ATP-binding cassette subfamily B protein
VASVKDADLIVVMDNGKIADAGTHGELMQRCAIYREVHDSQTKGGGEDE